MTRYIKKCPQCAHPNAEEASFCEIDDVNLMFVDPQPETSGPVDRVAESAPEDGVAAAPDDQSPSSQNQQGAPAANEKPAAAKLTCSKPGTESETLTLVSEHNFQEYVVHDGCTLGRGHDTSEADVRLNHEPGIDAVHRTHCRFGYSGGRWHVTAIDQRSRGRCFRNETSVSGRVLGANESQPLRKGDRLILAGSVAFRVRVN